MPDDNAEQTTRRKMLQRIGGAAAVSAFPILGQNPPPESHHSPTPVTKQAATAYRYQHFAPDQLKTLDALTETIIPADDHSPGAKDAGVSEYIDAIVADAPDATKQLWDQGLAFVNNRAEKSFGQPYAACSSRNQISVLQAISDEQEHFFPVLKRATIDGYYTSKVGIHQDLQYQGNDALPEFPGCQHPTH